MKIAPGLSQRTLLFLFACFGLVLHVSAQTGNRIPSTAAFSAGCSSAELGGVTLDVILAQTKIPSPARLDPEWAVITTDPTKSLLDQPLQVVEGSVPLPQIGEEAKVGNDYQAVAEVAEEDMAWTHYTHDYTFKLTPDPAYEKNLSYYVISDDQKGNVTYGNQPDMEVEWESASMMDESEGFQRIWGAMPEFVWPSYGDRIWTLGRWIFDCGHPGTPSSDPTNQELVRFETEIHSPRALVTQRINHVALDSFPWQRTSEPSYPSPQSYLPVTGEPEPGATIFPTWVPLTEADIFVSGNAGGANDLCSFIDASPPYSNYTVLLDNGYTSCGSGHTNPVVPVNDRYYVFDIYPPGTDYTLPDKSGKSTKINGNEVYPWTVYRPVSDASLQYRIVDHDGEIPAHTCGTGSAGDCTTVAPIICLIDDNTGPPDQSETACPAVPARQPTRLRVILPFQGTDANYFAKSILLGWDDVPNPNTCGSGGCNLGMRTFRVRLHKLTVNSNGEDCCTSGNWRVFLNVNGQWRYLSPYFDTDQGTYVPNGGNNVCDGEALTDNGDDDCFQFDKTPFVVSVRDGDPIHIGVGGFISRDVEDDTKDAGLCRNYLTPTPPGGCDPRITVSGFKDLFFHNDDRIGTYEFDLISTNSYSPPNVYQTGKFPCQVGDSIFYIAEGLSALDLLGSGWALIPLEQLLGDCEIQYTADFTVEEVSASAPPTSGDPAIGKPNYVGNSGTFVTSSTPVTLTPLATATNFQYRFYKQGGVLPSFASALSFPVHWTSADVAGNPSVDVFLNGAGGASGDGPYNFQYSAEQSYQLLEQRHTKSLILDNTPPATTFVQPYAGATYGHSAMLTLSYSVSDGTGSGVDASTLNPKMDSQTSAQFGASLANMATIYLESMSLGAHAFSVDAADNLGNAGTSTVTFTITVTFDSLAGDVTGMPSGCIDNISQSLLAKISAAKNAYSKGQVQTAINILQALIYEVQAQAGKHMSTLCKDPSGRTFNPVLLLLGDTQYLQASLSSQLKPNPPLGVVADSNNQPIGGATVNLKNSAKTVIATASTDAYGEYYFAGTSALSGGANYTITVVLPKGYKSSTPTAQAFTWSGNLVQENFVLQ